MTRLILFHCLCLGLLKSIITIFVFIASHFSFCGLQSSQCFTYGKGLSAVVVVLGVLCYSKFSHENSGEISDDVIDGGYYQFKAASSVVSVIQEKETKISIELMAATIPTRNDSGQP